MNDSTDIHITHTHTHIYIYNIYIEIYPQHTYMYIYNPTREFYVSSEQNIMLTIIINVYILYVYVCSFNSDSMKDKKTKSNTKS